MKNTELDKPAVLQRTQFGNPILRTYARHVPVGDIQSDKIQQLVADMRHTLIEKKLGIGLAAPQVGEPLAVIVIAIRPLAHRQQVEPFDLTLINPEITETFGRKSPMWEGCISGGPGRASIMAQVPRYKKIRIKYHDETGKLHHKIYEGFQAHVMQHEVDHLHGILFVDKVRDTKSFITYAEYKKRARKVLKSSRAGV
jgi:peptide deformylase